MGPFQLFLQTCPSVIAAQTKNHARRGNVRTLQRIHAAPARDPEGERFRNYLPVIASKGEIMSFFKLNVPFFVVYSLMFLGGHVVPAEMCCTFRIFLTEHVHRPITDAINAAPLCFQENVEAKTYDKEEAQQATADRGGLSSMLACRLHPAQRWR